MRSIPLPPSRMSSPAPPTRWSLPEKPWSLSLPPRPSIRSFRADAMAPLSRSAPDVAPFTWNGSAVETE
ncbi:hypothetical protein FPV16_19925 [Methylobacterium sp. W2]|nr:hypothetical protein [Methylobacterium sp. W2]